MNIYHCESELYAPNNESFGKYFRILLNLFVTYASKEAAESLFYDYLSVYRRDLLAWCVGYKVYVNFVQLYLD